MTFSIMAATVLSQRCTFYSVNYSKSLLTHVVQKADGLIAKHKIKGEGHAVKEHTRGCPPAGLDERVDAP